MRHESILETPKEKLVANREHKAYPNIRKTPFYSPEVAVVRSVGIENLLPQLVSTGHATG